MQTKYEHAVGRKIGYILAIIANIFAMYIVNNILLWKLGFLTGDYIKCLPLLRLSIFASITSNLVFIVHDAKWFKSIVEIFTNFLAVAVMYTFFTVYPFVLPGFLDLIFKIVLLAGMFGVIVATVITIITWPFSIFSGDHSE